MALIRGSWRASGGVYGSRRVLGDLREIGELCGKHRVARIMRQHRAKAPRGYILVVMAVDDATTFHRPGPNW
ncbi:IS3 family transposase [Chromobacterium vaccinii]|uniref:IS3 family transposase n=1 Tax=Chromobacterium TaxID=535 RepID=UPI0009DA883B